MASNEDAIEVARLQKNSREVLIIGLQTYRGHRLVSVRAWVPTDDGGMIPTKGGISIKASLLPALRTALAEAETKAKELGWMDGGAHG